MKAEDLAKELMKHPDFDVRMTVHRELSEDELNIHYPYPYESIKSELQIDDIGHSDKVICMGCEI